MVKAGSQMALIPIWFLAVYIGVVVLVPLTYRAWRRFGMASFWTLAVLVGLNDVLFFAADLRSVGWLNYGFIWVAVHQLGYAWRDGKLQSGWKALAWTVAGLAILITLVALGPFPLSMVSVPGEEVSNSLPPKLPMLLLGMIQIGLALALETPFRRWLRRPAPWTATVLVNGMIMTIFLWHLTASTLVTALAAQLGDLGLALEPGGGMGWATRPAWLATFVIVLAGFALVFGVFERGGAGGPPAAAWRQITGAALICGGLSLLALDGVGGDGWLGLRWWVVALPLAGAVIGAVNPIPEPTSHA